MTTRPPEERRMTHYQPERADPTPTAETGPEPSEGLVCGCAACERNRLTFARTSSPGTPATEGEQ